MCLGKNLPPEKDCHVGERLVHAIVLSARSLCRRTTLLPEEGSSVGDRFSRKRKFLLSEKVSSVGGYSSAGARFFWQRTIPSVAEIFCWRQILPQGEMIICRENNLLRENVSSARKRFLCLRTIRLLENDSSAGGRFLYRRRFSRKNILSRTRACRGKILLPGKGSFVRGKMRKVFTQEKKAFCRRNILLQQTDSRADKDSPVGERSSRRRLTPPIETDSSVGDKFFYKRRFCGRGKIFPPEKHPPVGEKLVRTILLVERSSCRRTILLPDKYSSVGDRFFCKRKLPEKVFSAGTRFFRRRKILPAKKDSSTGGNLRPEKDSAARGNELLPEKTSSARKRFFCKRTILLSENDAAAGERLIYRMTILGLEENSSVGKKTFSRKMLSPEKNRGQDPAGGRFLCKRI